MTPSWLGAIQDISSFKDLYIDDVFASFEQLSDKFSIPRPRQHFYTYLQVRSLASKTFSSFSNLPDSSVLDNFLTPIPTLKVQSH